MNPMENLKYCVPSYLFLPIKINYLISINKELDIK